MNIVITGVSRGLGRALCDFFIKEGHTVAGCSRSADAILDLRFDHEAPNRFDVVDITQSTKVDIWMEKVTATMPAPDLLINNAGHMNNPAPLWKVPEDDFNKTIDINLKGTANIIRAFVPHMVARKQGVIVNFSSGWGRSVSPEVAPYCAAKWGIEGLTAALSEELPKGMAAVALNPGVINTELLKKCWDSHASDYPDPETWVKTAGPFILKLASKDNGKALSIPGM